MLKRLAGRYLALMVAVCSWIGGPLASAQPLADRVPGDALIYIGWGGSQKMGPGFEGSHLQAVLKESEIPKLINESVPAFLKKLGAQDPQAAQITGLISAIGGPMWRHPSALYFGGMDTSIPNRPPTPKFALLCDAGAEGKALADVLRQIIAGAKAPYDIKVDEQGGNVAVHAGIAGYGAGVKPAAALPADKGFQFAMSKAGKSPVLAIYVNMEGIITLAEGMIPPNSPPAQAWPKIRDALGLKSIKRVIATSGFDGKDWMSHAFIDAPAPRTGMVAQLMSTKPVDEEFLKAIPESATTAVAGRFDVGGLVNAIRAAVVQIEPSADREISQAIEKVRQQIGIDPQKDLIDVLGDQWAIYNDPMAGGSGVLGMVLVNKPKDAAKLEASVSQLEDMANGMMRQARGQRPGEPQFEIKRATSRNTNLHYFSLPIISPTWAVRDGYWYAALYPQVVVGAAEHVGGKGKSILDNTDYQALRKRLGDQKATSVSFMNLPKTAPDSYGQVLLMSRLLLGAADLFGADSPPMVLPTLNKLMPHLSVAGGVSWIDDTGWHMKAVEPFPGSTLLTPGAGGQILVGTQAMTLSILLPSLNRAREAANRVKCGSNLRQIGQGLHIYANDNRGKFPADLGMLITAVDMSPEVFVCPSSNTGTAPQPANFPDRAQWQQQTATWVNANSDYVYLGKGLGNTAGADVVICHEKPHGHGSTGMNLLFGDGHVEWMHMPEAMRAIEKSKPGKAGGI